MLSLEWLRICHHYPERRIQYGRKFRNHGSAYYVDGEPYCMPTYAYKYCFLNKDMLDEAGIPVANQLEPDELERSA